MPPQTQASSTGTSLQQRIVSGQFPQVEAYEVQREENGDQDNKTPGNKDRQPHTALKVDEGTDPKDQSEADPLEMPQFPRNL